jgi:hypothetical protein
MIGGAPTPRLARYTTLALVIGGSAAELKSSAFRDPLLCNELRRDTILRHVRSIMTWLPREVWDG